MPSAFAARDARLSRALERTFGEEFTFTARKVAAADVNLPRVADGTRAAFDCVGIWEGWGKSALLREQRGDEDAMKRSAQYNNVLVAVDLLAWTPQVGDVCKRLLDNSVFEVVNVLHDDAGGVLIYLSNKKG